MVDAIARKEIERFIFQERHDLKTRGVRASKWRAAIGRRFVERFFPARKSDDFTEVWVDLERQGVL